MPAKQGTKDLSVINVHYEFGMCICIIKYQPDYILKYTQNALRYTQNDGLYLHGHTYCGCLY